MTPWTFTIQIKKIKIIIKDDINTLISKDFYDSRAVNHFEHTF